jgi:Raf kinase inhibitor-like YbhB/YbcL family protein
MMRRLCIGAFMLTGCHVVAQDNGTHEPQLTIIIPAFTDGSNLPDKYSCKNAPAGVSPQIKWMNVPAGTQSFAIMLHDPDRRPRGGVYDILHWLIWNIPGTARELPEGVPTRVDLPDGSRQLKRVNHAFYPVASSKGVPGTPEWAQSPSDTGLPSAGYLGPCGPPGGPNHHYTFELYALDKRLDLDANTGRADVMKAMDGHILQSAVYIALFRR